MELEHNERLTNEVQMMVHQGAMSAKAGHETAPHRPAHGALQAVDIETENPSCVRCRQRRKAHQRAKMSSTTQGEPDGEQTALSIASKPLRWVAVLACALFGGFVVVFGIWGESLTVGVDAACAEAAFAAGKRHEARGNYDEAIALYRRALKGRFQEEARAYMCGRSIGDVYFRLGRYDDAIEAYGTLPEGAFEGAGALTGYVSALRRQGLYDEAEQRGKQWLEQAQLAQDTQQQVWANHILGQISHETGRDEEAVGYFAAVREADPASETNVAIARLLAEMGREKDAIAHLDALLAHGEPGRLYNEAEELRETLLRKVS